MIANCTADVIEIGTNHSQLGIDLYQYLPILIKLLEGCEKGKLQIDIIKICLHCCKNVGILFSKGPKHLNSMIFLFFSSQQTIDLHFVASQKVSSVLFVKPTTKVWTKIQKQLFLN